MKIAGSGSGFISQRHGSADPDRHQNVMDPQHWVKRCAVIPPILSKLVGASLLTIVVGEILTAKTQHYRQNIRTLLNNTLNISVFFYDHQKHNLQYVKITIHTQIFL
jgi:hypothetical protein